MTKRLLANKEMCDPDWIHKKTQDYFALKNALDRFSWGAAYIPVACQDAYWNICKEMARMDEPIKAWKPEKPHYYRLKSRRGGGKKVR